MNELVNKLIQLSGQAEHTLVWGTSLICIVIASWLRVNQVVMQLGNYLMYPVQIILFIPYVILGEKLFTTSFLPGW